MHLAAHGNEQHIVCRPGDPTLRTRCRVVAWVTCLRTQELRLGRALQRLGEEAGG